MYQNENRPTWATRICNVKGSKINSFVTLASYNNPILLDHPLHTSKLHAYFEQNVTSYYSSGITNNNTSDNDDLVTSMTC